LERIASWRPLRCMMFLNWEWPAMVSLRVCLEGGARYRTMEGGNKEKCRDGLGLTLSLEGEVAEWSKTTKPGERLCWLSSASPFLAISEDCVEDGEELSGD